MNEIHKQLTLWMASTPAYTPRLPTGTSMHDVLTSWIYLGSHTSAVDSEMEESQVDDFVQHCAHHIQHAVWWDSSLNNQQGAELKLKAIASCPEVLAAACRATLGRCVGCLMFWDELVAGYRDIYGRDEIWSGIKMALHLQSAQDETCLASSARLGLEVVARVEAGLE